jgi:hypothetical protein
MVGVKGLEPSTLLISPIIGFVRVGHSDQPKITVVFARRRQSSCRCECQVFAQTNSNGTDPGQVMHIQFEQLAGRQLKLLIHVDPRAARGGCLAMPVSTDSGHESCQKKRDHLCCQWTRLP